MGLLGQRIDWLCRSGTDQWSTRPFDSIIADSICRGETWLLWQGDEAIATITLTTVADQDFWSQQERRTPAFYLSKLATSLAHRSQGLGALLIDWAMAYATARGVLWLRWDVWRSNEKLQAYYRSLGASHLRTEDVPGRNSGALFEMSRAGRDKLDISTTTEFAPVLTLPSIPRASASDRFSVDLYGYAGVDSAGNQLGHEYGRLVDRWKTSSLDTASFDDPSATEVYVSRHSRPLLHDPGDGWQLRGFFGKPVGDTWPPGLDPESLRRGQVYQLRLSADHSAVQLFGDVDW